ncbi:MAG: fibronectin type III domain-containing protein [Eubacteriales bacterium]|nr:fibronectin type III domain-containing protein [Eubacteriales bacterium]
MKQWILAVLLTVSGLLTVSAVAIEDTEVEPVIISHENVIHDIGTSTNIAQSICSDGKRYVYYCVYQGNDNKPTLIKRYDTRTGEIFTSTDNHVYGHANGMAYVPDEDMLYVVSLDGNSTIYQVNARTLNYVSEFSIEEKICKNIPGASECGAIAYDSVRDQFLCLISPYDGKRAFAVFDRKRNFKQYKEFTKVYTAGGIASDENYIYLTYWQSAKKNWLSVFDRGGNELTKIPMNWYKEIEGVAKIGNDYYLAFNDTGYRAVEIEKCTICGLQTGGHPYDDGVVTTQPTCTEKGVKTYTCTLCKKTKTEPIPANGHKLTKTPAKEATYAQVGNKEYYTCTVCKKLFADAEAREETSMKDVLLVRLVKTPLNQCKVTLSKSSYIYNGKAKKPTVTVKNGSKTVSRSEYTVAYSNNKKVGKATVILTAKSGSVNFAGKISKTFTINPPATSLRTVSSGTKSFTVKWSKKTTQTTGYQIQYSTKSSFAGAKTKTIAKTKTTSTKVSKLTAKKKYYVRIRTYKTVGGKKYYSSWSKAKNVVTKK